MYLLDANILLYAMRDLFPQHARAKAWLEETLGGSTAVVIPDFVEIAVMRIATNRRVFTPPSTVAQAEEFLKRIHQSPVVQPFESGPHWRRTFYRFCREIHATGDDVTDCYLAALAVDAGAILVSADQGFARFHNLRWIDPVGGE